MSDNQPKPREFDAVLGGKAPPPANGLVLGGLEGVKQRLKSSVARERAAALIDALRHREEGLNLLVEALQDSSEQVQLFASRLLRQRGGNKGKQALLRHNPWLFFTKLEEWKFEDFYSDIGITASVTIACSVDLGQYLDEFKALLQDPLVSKVEALACTITDDIHRGSRTFINTLCKACRQLTSLKVLSIRDYRDPDNKSRLYLSDISSVLEAYPYLEVLEIWGSLGGKSDFRRFQHNCLKTLIIGGIVETVDISYQPLTQIFALDLPALEYLELWGGYSRGRGIDSLKPLLTGQPFPSLCYLGLPHFEDTDKLIEAIAQSPILARLTVLDISLGELTDKGAEILLKCPAINQLHTLNVAKNCLSTEMVQRLAKLNCRVIAEPQHESEHRYYALNE